MKRHHPDLFGVAVVVHLPQEQGLDKNGRLSDIQGKPQEQTEKQPPIKKQRVTDKPSPAAGGVSSGEKVRKGTLQGLQDRPVSAKHTQCNLALRGAHSVALGFACRSCMRGCWRQSASVLRQRRHEETTCARLL